MTEFLSRNGWQLSYDVAGEGPLVVMAPGMGTVRAFYADLADRLVAAGYRVAKTDLRGHGESGTEWGSYSRTDTAADLLALVNELGGGPAVLVGNSFAGGSATIAAAKLPELVSAIVEIAPFTRPPKLDVRAMCGNPRYRKGTALLLGTGITRSIALWTRYLDHAFPGVKPASYARLLAGVTDSLRQPGRMRVVQRMGLSRPKDAAAALPDVHCPALVIMGTLDSDWPDPRAEADAVVAAMPAGVGEVAMIDGAGHYPHAQFPGETAEVIISFLVRRGLS
jgi:pimeloyl-ACP methyl ester carboxylesterase